MNKSDQSSTDRGPSLPLHTSSSTSHGCCPHEEDEGRPKVQDDNNYDFAIDHFISTI
jgi:hypothetical protein